MLRLGCARHDAVAGPCGRLEDLHVRGPCGRAVGLVLIAFAALRFRRTARNPQPRSQRENNAPLEIAWTVAPLVLVIVLFGVTYHIENDVEHLAPNAPVQIAVNAYRWAGRSVPSRPDDQRHAQRPPEMVLPLAKRRRSR